MAAENVIPIRPTDGGPSTLSGIYDGDGSTWVKVRPGQHLPSSGGGGKSGDGDVISRLDKLEQHRTWLWTVLSTAIGLAVAGIVGSFFILDDRIQDRFDVADNRNREISKSLSDLDTEIAVQGRGIEQILERVDADQSKASNRAK